MAYDEVIDGGRPIEGVATAVAAFIGLAEQGPFETPLSLTSFTEFRDTFGGHADHVTMSFAVRDFFANGGTDAVVVRLGGRGGDAPDGAVLTASDIVGPGLEEDGRGLYALDRVDLFSLLVIPPHTRDGGVDPEVVRAADAYCRSRRAILLLDGLPRWAVAGDVLAAYASGLDAVIGTSSADAALFYPRLRQPNPLRRRELGVFSALGAVAGVIARTDAQVGVWASPAGPHALLNRVSELDVDLSTREVSALTAAGVNCLRSVPGGGHVVWGARTMQGGDASGSEWKYLSVRRTALFIEESLARGTRWVTFEPNTEETWTQVREHVDEFMHGLFREGAFPGSSRPSDGYFVKCGRDTMTEHDIESGVLTVTVGFAPIRPGEFVVVRVQQTAGASR